MDIFRVNPEYYNNIYGCDLFLSEKQSLYKKDYDASKSYEKWLDKKLRFLDTEGLDVISKFPQVFEKLSDTSDLYCIRKITRNKNPRILFFAIIEEEEDPAFVLLTAFHESNNGDYPRAIKIAEERRKMILETLKEEETIL